MTPEASRRRLRCEEVALARLRLQRAPTNERLGTAYVWCEACCGDVHVVDSARHRVFQCAAAGLARLAAAPALRAALRGVAEEELSRASDEDVVRRFFTWDLLVAMSHEGLPAGRLERLVTLPPTLRRALTDVLVDFLWRARLVRLFTGSWRVACTRALAIVAPAAAARPHPAVACFAPAPIGVT